MCNRTSISGVIRPRAYEGEDAGNQDAAAAAAAAAAAKTPPAGHSSEVTFTPEQQTKLNKLVADEKRKAQEGNRQLVADLETLKQSKNLSEQEKIDLQKRIDDLTATYTTREQLAQSDLQKLQRKYDTDTKTLGNQTQAWQDRYNNKLKTIDLREAATSHGAINPTQVEKLLWDQTVVEEELDESGKPTGAFTTKVNFTGKDKEGKPVQLKLSPKDAVKAMTEIPEEYGNLFESKAKGGLGQGGVIQGAGSGNLPNLENMSPQQWTQYRAKIREQMAKQG